MISSVKMLINNAVYSEYGNIRVYILIYIMRVILRIIERLRCGFYYVSIPERPGK